MELQRFVAFVAWTKSMKLELNDIMMSVIWSTTCYIEPRSRNRNFWLLVCTFSFGLISDTFEPWTTQELLLYEWCVKINISSGDILKLWFQSIIFFWLPNNIKLLGWMQYNKKSKRKNLNELFSQTNSENEFQ